MAKHPLEIHRFFKDKGIEFIQFTPIVERLPNSTSRTHGLLLAGPAALDRVEEEIRGTPWTVDAEEYGDFLIAIYGEWVRHDVGKVFVMNFEWALNAWIGNNMRKHSVLLIVSITLILGLIHFLGSVPGNAGGKDEIDRGVNSALEELYNKYPAARDLSKNAKAVLVFPEIIKDGFVEGGLYGEGTLRKGSKTVGYYNTVAASYGLQAGLQKYGHALFFITNSAIAYLDRING